MDRARLRASANSLSPALLDVSPRGAFTPEESQISQRIGEFPRQLRRQRQAFQRQTLS
jgi:hypothetical protein